MFCFLMILHQLIINSLFLGVFCLLCFVFNFFFIFSSSLRMVKFCFRNFYNVKEVQRMPGILHLILSIRHI